MLFTKRRLAATWAQICDRLEYLCSFTHFPTVTRARENEQWTNIRATGCHVYPLFAGVAKGPRGCFVTKRNFPVFFSVIFFFQILLVFYSFSLVGLFIHIFSILVFFVLFYFFSWCRKRPCKLSCTAYYILKKQAAKKSHCRKAVLHIWKSVSWLIICIRG